MDVLISNVGCSILATIIYDISKVCLGKFYYKKDNLDKIEELLRKGLNDKFEVLYMSGEFNSFLKTPFFRGTIENYIIFKITGYCEGNIIKIKKSTDIIVEKDIIEFLCNYLFQEYYERAITIPSKSLVRQFFEAFFKIASNYVVSMMKDEDRINVFFINKRLDLVQENILLRLDETIETITRTMKCEVVPFQNIYADYVTEYHKILETNHSRAHVYLLDTFDFAEFYVPPFLRQISSKHKVKEHI